MGVRTTADEALDEARKAVKNAAELLNKAMSAIVLEDVWGASEFSPIFKQKLIELNSRQLELHRDLNE